MKPWYGLLSGALLLAGCVSRDPPPALTVIDLIPFGNLPACTEQASAQETGCSIPADGMESMKAFLEAFENLSSGLKLRVPGMDGSEYSLVVLPLNEEGEEEAVLLQLQRQYGRAQGNTPAGVHQWRIKIDDDTAAMDIEFRESDGARPGTLSIRADDETMKSAIRALPKKD